MFGHYGDVYNVIKQTAVANHSSYTDYNFIVDDANSE
jgi:hypothetical protein